MTRYRAPLPPRPDAVLDELLVIMASEGDARAFERLHQRWHLRLARAARRYTGSAESARDLSQDCWLAIWKGLGRLRDPARFRAYAFGVLHRRGADHLRRAIKESAHRAPVEDAPEGREPARQDEQRSLKQAFESLPPDQRLAAHLHFVEGLTLSEIAEAQSIPTGTAKSRLFHARRKLKAALTDTPEGDDA
ncbi:MAG: RNA polymerase sigma factor [Erythrobacter sp.]|uniref:RNA polymerase sigma factor n=1 Tax=Erythrobacter sp. TaxID=1042 RepID=UPI00260330E0|nr:RNA polymerase sigma factor [Erythrobacter sp.]MDJ0976921.1 RNA polymerase sigma factor [Erythrobacter sp.]